MGKRGTLTVRIIGESKHLKRTLAGVTDKVGVFAKKALKIGAAATAAVGVASVKAFANFDQAMTESVAIMGDVSDTMRQDMADAAREVGKTTKFSASEAAESYFFLASAGMDAEQSIAALPQVAAFAQAGMFDMATATDLATDAQSALGLASDDAEENLANLTRVTDVFVKANTLANTSVEQVSEAMTNKAGAAMRALGMEIEEGTAVLAAFADQGVKGQMAGTQFAIVLRDLQTKALNNKQAFAEAGVSVFDAQGEFRNMADIVGDLEGLLGGMTDAQRKATLATLGFSDKSMGALTTLLGTSDAIREYQGELESASGVTQEVADNQMKSFSAKMGLVWSKIQDVGISIGKALVPALEIFAGWLDSNLPAITGWFDAVSSKFEGLFGTADDTMAGTAEAMFGAGEAVHGFDNAVKDALGMTEERLHGYDVAVGDVSESTEDNFLDMGQMMGKLAEIWKGVFEDDIKPWFNDTFIPWLTDTAAPAVGRAGVKIGAALASGLLEALEDLDEQIVASLPGWAQGIVGGSRKATDLMGGVASGVQRVNRAVIPGVGGDTAPQQQTIPTNLRSFHEGGVVPGRPGQETLAILEAGETVIPADGGAGGVYITVNVPGGFVGNEQELGEKIVSILTRRRRVGQVSFVPTASP